MLAGFHNSIFPVRFFPKSCEDLGAWHPFTRQSGREPPISSVCQADGGFARLESWRAMGGAVLFERCPLRRPHALIVARWDGELSATVTTTERIVGSTGATVSSALFCNLAASDLIFTGTSSPADHDVITYAVASTVLVEPMLDRRSLRTRFRRHPVGFTSALTRALQHLFHIIHA